MVSLRLQMSIDFKHVAACALFGEACCCAHIALQGRVPVSWVSGQGAIQSCLLLHIPLCRVCCVSTRLQRIALHQRSQSEPF